MDEIQERELASAIANMARWSRNLYLRLTDEGFTPAEALRLTAVWWRTTQGGASGGDE